MSAQTRAALEAAIDAHLAEDGETSTAYLLVVAGTSMELIDRNVTAYSILMPEGQASHVSTGLATFLNDQDYFAQTDDD